MTGPPLVEDQTFIFKLEAESNSIIKSQDFFNFYDNHGFIASRTQIWPLLIENEARSWALSPKGYFNGRGWVSL